MEPIGIRLKRAREERQLSLREIAGETKISVSALEALERGDYSRLPGGIFGRAFVRAYALHVGLDPDAIVDEFQAEVIRRERDATRTRKQPGITADDRAFAERQRRAIRTLQFSLIAIILLALGFLAWRLWYVPSP
jgi:cytoskeletal protein RodZ